MAKKEQPAEFPSEEEIKIVVSGYRMWSEELKERIRSVRQELEETENPVPQRTEPDDEEPGKPPRGNHGGGKDRQAMLVKEDGAVYGREESRPDRDTPEREGKRRRCRQEMHRALTQLEGQQIRIRRIYLAYMTLPLEEYQVLHALYEEKIPWRRISQHLGVSKQTAVKRRHEAIRHIREKLPGEERKENRRGCEWDFPWNGTNLNMMSAGF